jgi:hypothetical protein
MNYRLTTVLLAVALLLVLGVSVTQAASNGQPVASIPQVAPAGAYDFVEHGTNWEPGVDWWFASIIHYGWGTKFRATAAGTNEVHISIPITTRMANTLLRLQYVEFCLYTDNAVNSKPVTWKLWEYPKKNFSVPFTWDSTKNQQCLGYTFSNPVFRQDLGFSVQLQFGNNFEEITLYKAWARFIP